MGAFVANLHVRTDQRDAIRQNLTQLGVSDYRLTAPQRGWISIYERQASTQDEAWIEHLARELSSRLKSPCVAFLVHDSDIARYWLCDNGQLLDEYNSIPDYFDQASAAERQRLRGQSDVFLRYCQPTVTRSQVEQVLRTDVTFAEDTVRQLAEFLGIEPDRTLEDFRDDESDGGPDGWRTFGDDGDEDDGDEEGGGTILPFGAASRERISQLMQQQFASVQVASRDAATSPQSDALVRAAAAGDLAEIERLVQAGADVNAPGMLKIEPVGTSHLMAAPDLPSVPAPPLLAAASRGQATATERLIELGASAGHVHPLFGSALHVAVQKGSPETVEVLLAAGVRADLKNHQGQTAPPFYKRFAVRSK
jgi:hypothetical protein